MIRLNKERREKIVESVVEDSCEFDVDSFLKRTVAEIRKRKRADDEFEEMRRRDSEKREQDRMSSEYEKRYCDGAAYSDREQWEKKIRREANVYRDIQRIRQIDYKRSYTLFEHSLYSTEKR
nr:hypothetical protein [Tanacetum cinerariifolium]